MNLPQLTAYIGESVQSGNNEFSSLIKKLKSVKETEKAYIVTLVMDLKAKEIDFCLYNECSENSVDLLYYFGNNSAASSQYYLVRETEFLNYLLGSVWNDLFLMLQKNAMMDTELASIIESMDNLGLISLGSKKGEGRVNLENATLFKDNPPSDVVLDKTIVKFDDKSHNFETFIRLFLKDENKNNRFVLVVPVVRMEDGQEVILSTHPDYLDLVKKKNNLGTDTKDKKGTKRVCYVCGKIKPGVSSIYSKDFSRKGINKIFTTTKKNTSPYLQGFDYDNVYSMCTGCYQKLRAGEKIIYERFRGKIADEDVFIVPESLVNHFDYNLMDGLKNAVDFAFSSKSADNWLKSIESSVVFDVISLYVLNFIIYRTDGNSVNVLEIIEDVPTIRLEKVMKMLAHNVSELENHIRNFSLQHIYRIIPVRTNRLKEQLDIGRVLSLYKAILSGELISSECLYGYAADALDKGMRQLGKSKLNNFMNMDLDYYTGDKEDFFIKRILMSYLVLFRTCQQLNLLDCPVFDFQGKEECSLGSINTASEKINMSVMQMEDFLDRQGFGFEARALFYLGVLVNRVAIAQMVKEHRTKPILKKIQFQGMNDKEVYRLYQDVVEKLRQYNKLTLFAEAVMNRFHYHYGSLERTWPLSEHENVFFIMSGYAYLVGNRSPDITSSEEHAQVQDIEDEDEDENNNPNMF